EDDDVAKRAEMCVIVWAEERLVIFVGLVRAVCVLVELPGSIASGVDDLKKTMRHGVGWVRSCSRVGLLDVVASSLGVFGIVLVRESPRALKLDNRGAVDFADRQPGVWHTENLSYWLVQKVGIFVQVSKRIHGIC